MGIGFEPLKVEPVDLQSDALSVELRAQSKAFQSLAIY
jgi:hypothetical protein